jgi:hypothetical protein
MEACCRRLQRKTRAGVNMGKVVDNGLEVNGIDAAIIHTAEKDFRMNCMRPIHSTISNWTLKT